MIEKKGCGDKKINRVGVSLSNQYEAKLNRLATACQKRPTTLAGMLIEICLDSPEIIDMLQEKYNVYTAYKVLPIENYMTGEIELVLAEKD
ncbi:hypothetical protein [Schinkia azotoformans]|uniref:hypothetical protein n=1 Tax=Schinkia azotoformans TaxID=1454 RepID=UPI002DBBB127|nr:hypothetical protein [Schinkia azotoformans]MEC1716577.1 hypothetical protein [Schinkia azotoformans]MEC1739415.1 hypothetical protein [Schinkia azotoformans]MEC1745515.1 hypothetical protein [Schinkia azotoformans]MEC1756578.1 hypothetical protein [Schinkia azotoformans]MEC1765845.1 hypothetical protein [Schinkia azotoformans]